MHYAEANVKQGRPGWFRVMKHEPPLLALPSLNPDAHVRVGCGLACNYDRIVLDFLPSWELAQLLAQKLERQAHAKVQGALVVASKPRGNQHGRGYP